jgi:DNA-binding response OmpR family regulator
LIQDVFSMIPTQSYRLERLSDGDAAVESLLRGSFDVCFLDYRPGEKNGLELLGRLSINGCTTPIIFLSGQGDHHVHAEARRAGADDYLAKEELNPGLLERSRVHPQKGGQGSPMEDNVVDLVPSLDVVARSPDRATCTTAGLHVSDPCW